MNASLRRHALVSILWAMAAVSAVSVQAQTRTYTYRTRTVIPAPPEVQFSYYPQWEAVPGTNVLMIRQGQRPNYDMFSYGSNYYIYNSGYWYQASNWQGPFTAIAEADLPRAVHYVPQREWNSYPSSWVTSNTEIEEGYEDAGGYYDASRDAYVYNSNGYTRDGSYNADYDRRTSRTYNVSSAPPAPNIYFRENPHWVKVPGTSVLVVRNDERPNVDLFYQGGSYYTYDNGYWYRSDGWNGPYAAIDAGSVPRVMRSVPRSMWISYPSNWNNERTYQNTSYQVKKHRTVVKKTTRRY